MPFWLILKNDSMLNLLGISVSLPIRWFAKATRMKRARWCLYLEDWIIGCALIRLRTWKAGACCKRQKWPKRSMRWLKAARTVTSWMSKGRESSSQTSSPWASTPTPGPTRTTTVSATCCSVWVWLCSPPTTARLKCSQSTTSDQLVIIFIPYFSLTFRYYYCF